MYIEPHSFSSTASSIYPSATPTTISRQTTWHGPQNDTTIPTSTPGPHKDAGSLGFLLFLIPILVVVLAGVILACCGPPPPRSVRRAAAESKARVARDNAARGYGVSSYAASRTTTRGSARSNKNHTSTRLQRLSTPASNNGPTRRPMPNGSLQAAGAAERQRREEIRRNTIAQAERLAAERQRADDARREAVARAAADARREAIARATVPAVVGTGSAHPPAYSWEHPDEERHAEPLPLYTRDEPGDYVVPGREVEDDALAGMEVPAPVYSRDYNPWSPSPGR